MAADLKDALLLMSSRINYVSEEQKQAVDETIVEYFTEPPAPIVAGRAVTVSEVSDGG